MAKEKMLMPPAELEERPGDVPLPFDQFLQLSFFAQLKRKPPLDKYPGTLRLRRFRKGDVICRQGEAGWTAFSVLTTEDVLAVRQGQLQAATAAEKKGLEQEIARLRQRLEEGRGAGPTDPGRAVATVHLALARRPEPRQTGPLERLALRVLGRPPGGGGPRPKYIPIDGPTDVPYDSRQVPVYEGDLFGEMSSLFDTPRSATIVADRDCYMLEMLRNILDAVQRDEGYRARMEALYKERVLQNHLRRLSVFSDLTDEQFDLIRRDVELIRCEGGQVICEENDVSDSLYIIRSGLVKVVKNVSSLVGPDDVKDWPALCGALRDGEQQAAGPRGAVWALLGDEAREAVRRATGPAPPPADDQAHVVAGLNRVIKDPQLPAAAGVQAVLADAAFRERTRDLPAKRAEWPEQQRRRFNRRLLEAVFPGALHDRPEVILAYRSRGESLGEMGLMTRQPRSATCIAYVHPEPGRGHQAKGVGGKWRDTEIVELVRIPERTFWQIVDSSPAVRARLEGEVAARGRVDVERLRLPAWSESQPVALSGRFEALGLIQGQRLMLIDLDRCTRCDECVRACVDTHADGHSRLFLDGPRVGKYLVPTTCRSCRDPVCMIGCPVGSIHRGDSRQIVIEDWCIGCGLCAENCPYGSIQMHGLGLIPQGAPGWRYLPAAAVADGRWTRPGYADRHWLPGRAPFFLDRAFRDSLRAVGAGDEAGQAVYFRHEFQVPAAVLRSAAQFRVELTSTDGEATAWINGQEVKTDEKAKQGKRGYLIASAGHVLRAGRNVLAVRVNAAPGDRELLEVWLDEVRAPAVPLGMTGEFSEKPVQERAVVCDLCSEQFGRRPACVNACPHDAALRVDARSDFPVG